ncbi:MGMT family protein [Escherichia coli]
MGRVPANTWCSCWTSIIAKKAISTFSTNPGGLSDKLRDYLPVILALLIRFPLPQGDAISARSLENLALSPAGQVMHYGQLAERWAALARRMPLVRQTDRIHSIVVPCHRVIGQTAP